MRQRKMTIKNVELETGTRYSEDKYGSTKPILTIKVKIPGGVATYEIDIQEDFKTSLEYAQGLVK